MIVSKVHMMMLNRTNSIGENTQSRHVNSHQMTNNRYKRTRFYRNAKFNL